jgi:hypothetical protein
LGWTQLEYIDVHKVIADFIIDSALNGYHNMKHLSGTADKKILDIRSPEIEKS